MNRTILFLFILGFYTHSTVYALYNVAVCAIFKNEAPYLREWIEFHKLQGVSHFYLYNNNSTDKYISVLEPYIMDGLVTLIQWPRTYTHADHEGWLRIQTGAYMDCIRTYGTDVRWLAVIDTDEFLYCVDGIKLKDFLKDYESYAGVAVNWRKFGTSDVKSLPSGMLQIEAFTRCTLPTDVNNKYVKSIVQPKYVTGCRSPHWFLYQRSFFAVTIDKKRMKPNSNRSRSIILGNIRLNHYWTRCEEYFWKEKIPGRQVRRNHSTQKLLQHAADCNIDMDDSIQYYIPDLRNIMSSGDSNGYK